MNLREKLRKIESRQKWLGGPDDIPATDDTPFVFVADVEDMFNWGGYCNQFNLGIYGNLSGVKKDG